MRHARYPIDGDPLEDEPEWVVISAVELRWTVHVLESFTSTDDQTRAQLERLVADLKRTYEYGLGTCPVCCEKWHVEDECPEFDVPMPIGPHVLYRLLDDEGRVIYIGVTRNFRARMRVHRRNWSSLIASVLTETYDTAEEMFEAEKLAIHDESPPLNRAGVG